MVLPFFCKCLFDSEELESAVAVFLRVVSVVAVAVLLYKEHLFGRFFFFGRTEDS